MTALAEREVRVRVRRVLAALSDGPPQRNGALREQQVREAVHGEVWGYQREQVTSNGPVLPDPDRTEQEILAERFGLGPLQPLLEDPSVDSIFLDGPKRVDVLRGGQLERAAVRFDSDDELRTLIRRQAARQGKTLDEASPSADLLLEDGSRLHAVIPPISRLVTQVAIRKFTRRGSRLSDLARPETGTMTPDLAAFLEAAVRASLNIIVSGGTGSGKTTCLGALGLCIDDPQVRVITIEEVRELGLDLQLPRCWSWLTRLDNTEGVGAITQRDLVQRDALRMEPTRVLIGECRRDETLDLLRIMNSGHPSSMSSIHATSARQALGALRLLAAQAEERVPLEVLTQLISESIDLVVHLRKEVGPTGIRRVVAEVVEPVEPEQPLRFSTNPLWERRDGQLVRVGTRPRCMDAIVAAGVSYRWEVMA